MADRYDQDRPFVVFGVFGDGVEQDLSRWSSLEDALSERDLQRRMHSWGLRPPRFYVVDVETDHTVKLDWRDVGRTVAL